MPSSETVRRWQDRIAWPVGLATVWFVMYTSLATFEFGFAHPERSVVRYLFSADHLARPLGWLFLLSAALAAVGVAFYGYLLLSNH